MKQKNVEIWVGLFVFLGLCALLFLAFQSANLGTTRLGNETYTITAEFDNIGGLKPRSAVKSAGVVLGRVESINFDNKSFKALVTIRMDKRYQIPNDSSFNIQTAGLLGDQYIGIEPGGSEDMLQQNEKVAFTQSAIVLENLISQFLYNKADEGATSSKDNSHE